MESSFIMTSLGEKRSWKTLTRRVLLKMCMRHISLLEMKTDEMTPLRITGGIMLGEYLGKDMISILVETVNTLLVISASYLILIPRSIMDPVSRGQNTLHYLTHGAKYRKIPVVFRNVFGKGGSHFL
jgi:hypothetical protein